MPGMNSGINVSDPTVIAAFRAALLHQGLIALLIFAVLGLAWLLARGRPPAAALGGSAAARVGVSPPVPGSRAPGQAEPAGRRLLRIGFGLLWVLDGRPAGPAQDGGGPSRAGHLARCGQFPALGAANRELGRDRLDLPPGTGRSRRGMDSGRHRNLDASLGWGLVVWIFGESFGGIFAPGLSWLTGAPGAAFCYVVAGALIALPARAWHTPRLGRLTLAGIGLFLAGMAVLQAWPGRGFWQGTWHGRPGTLTGMVQAMAATSQPHFVAALVAGFGSVNAGYGFAVNMAVVAALALAGAVFLSRRPRLSRPALVAVTALCLADWVLIEDFGFFGGLGTDPNSMLPFALLAVAGYLGLARVPAAAEPAGSGTPVRWPDRARPGSLRHAVAAGGFRTVTAAGAVGVIILGAAPMAAAQLLGR